jgi:hypothetical protein
VTAAALRGDDGVLRAARLVEPDGTTVELAPAVPDDKDTEPSSIDPEPPRPF